MLDMRVNNTSTEKHTCPVIRQTLLCELYKFSEAQKKAERFGGTIQDFAILLNESAFLCHDLLDGLSVVKVGIGQDLWVCRTIYPSKEITEKAWSKIKASNRLPAE